MHLRSRLLLTLLLALAATTPQIRAQADDSDTIRVDTRLVVLHCSVLDRGGKQITTLPRETFKVFENNVEQEIRVFRREDIPVSLGIVIDNSGSMRDKRQKVEAASIRLVKASNRQDEVLVVNFNDDAFLDVPFTSDISKLEEGVARIDSRGGTAMRDAISMSLDHIKREAKKDKKAILLVSDGNDTASIGITLEKLIEKIQKSGVLIYAIGIFGSEEKRDAKKAKRALDAITQASGGLAFYPDTLEDVDRIADAVAHDIRNQYVIAYRPTNPNMDGTYRQIKVSAGSRYSVRTRSGYYATPDEQPRKRQAGMD